MSWFRKKEGKYWYFVEKIDGKEKQHYIGDDQAVKRKLAQSNNKLLVWNKKSGKNKCMSCGCCIAVCTQDALRFNKSDDGIIIDHSKCSRCGLCVEGCPEAVLKIIDKKLLPKPSKESTNKTGIASRRQIKPATTRPNPDIPTIKLPKKSFTIDLEIERCSPGCHAYDMGSRYLYSHNSKTPTGAMGGGGGGPAKNKGDIISSIKKCIQSQEKFYNAKSMIGKLINKTSLKFSKEDFSTA